MKELIERYKTLLSELENDLRIHHAGGIVARNLRIQKPVIEMIIKDLESLQPKGKTKEEVFNEQASKFMLQFDLRSFKRTHSRLWKTIEAAMESYANQQPEAGKDSVSVEAMSKLADRFMERSRELSERADEIVPSAPAYAKFIYQSRGWKYACYSLRDAIGIPRSSPQK